MATDSWNGKSDNWTTAADWSTGAQPGTTDTADIESGNPQITSNVGTIAAVYMNSASLSVEDGSLNVAQTLTNLSGNLNIDNTAASSTYNGTTFVNTPAAGGSQVSITGTLLNTGSTTIGNTGLAAATTVNVGAINNSGSISVTGSSATTAPPAATLNVAGAAGFGTAGSVTGNVTVADNASLQFASGSLNTIASGASLNLEGTQSNIGITGLTTHNSALSSLSEIDGTLLIEGNSVSTSATTLTNKGTINVGSNEFYSGSNSSIPGSLSVSGNLTNTGYIYAGYSYPGPGSISVGGTLTNSSYIYITGETVSAAAYKDTYSYNSVMFNSGGSAASVFALNGGTSSISGTVTGTGNLDFNGGTAVVNSGATLKSSNVTLGGNARVEIAAAAANVTSPFSFANNATATLQLDASVVSASGGSVSDSIVNFGSGDTVDLRSLAFASGATATYNATAGTLAVTSNGVTDTLTVAIPQATTFQATSDGSGGTNVTVICFATGTRIRTVRGDVAVEELRVGDMAVTASGSHRPIRWIGNRLMRPADHDKPWDVHPVRVRAEAFGAGLPERDLFLSPGHPVLVGADEDGIGGVLVPIMCLINGTTIARVPVETVTYWHVELDEHDVLLAEGLSAESFLDFGCRPWFENAADHALANPDFVVPGLDGRCRPVAVDGPAVEAERRRLNAVFAAKLASHCDWSSADNLFAQMR